MEFEKTVEVPKQQQNKDSDKMRKAEKTGKEHVQLMCGCVCVVWGSDPTHCLTHKRCTFIAYKKLSL